MRFNYNNIPIQWIYKLSLNNLEYEDHARYNTNFLYNTNFFESVCVKGNLGTSCFYKKNKDKDKEKEIKINEPIIIYEI